MQYLIAAARWSPLLRALPRTLTIRYRSCLCSQFSTHGSGRHRQPPFDLAHGQSDRPNSSVSGVGSDCPHHNHVPTSDINGLQRGRWVALIY